MGRMASITKYKRADGLAWGQIGVCSKIQTSIVCLCYNFVFVRTTSTCSSWFIVSAKLSLAMDSLVSWEGHLNLRETCKLSTLHPHFLLQKVWKNPVNILKTFFLAIWWSRRKEAKISGLAIPYRCTLASSWLHSIAKASQIKCSLITFLWLARSYLPNTFTLQRCRQIGPLAV